MVPLSLEYRVQSIRVALTDTKYARRNALHLHLIVIKRNFVAPKGQREGGMSGGSKKTWSSLEKVSLTRYTETHQSTLFLGLVLGYKLTRASSITYRVAGQLQSAHRFVGEN